MRHHIGTTLTLTTTAMVLGTTALADLTAQDVWDNHIAYYEATGATVTGTLVDDGGRMTVTDAALSYRFPFGIGSLQATLPPLLMIENADGSVTMDDPGEFVIAVAADIENEQVSAQLAVNHVNFGGTATGSPDDITYRYQAGAFTISLLEAALPEEGLEFVLEAAGEGYDVTSRVTTGDLITTEATSTVGPMAVKYTMQIDDIWSDSETTYAASETTTTVSLIPGGADILNLTPAIKAGMSIAFSSTAEGNAGRTSTTLGGDVISDQTSETGPSSALASINSDGIALSFSAADILLSLNQPDLLPFPIDIEATEMSGGYTFPILASEGPQPVGFDLGLAGLRMNQGIWALFDPNKTLPRDPMTLAIDMEGTAISDVDLFDVMALEDKFSTALPPVSLETLNVTELGLSAIGGSLAGSAVIAFDNTDLDTYDGFPKPIGDAFLTVTGANRVMDALVAAGAIGADEVSAARLGIGFLARATGEDSFETSVEFSEDGHLSLNGQRIR